MMLPMVAPSGGLLHILIASMLARILASISGVAETLPSTFGYCKDSKTAFT